MVVRKSTETERENKGAASIVSLLNSVNGSFDDLDPKNSSENETKTIPQVIYASRTHSQISQGNGIL